MSWVNLLTILYPIGSIYISVDSTSPANKIGGSWTQIVGAALRGSTTTGYVGSDNHTLTISEMPNHYHTFPRRTAWGNSGSANEGVFSYVSGASFGDIWLDSVNSSGTGASHSILQKSYNCYIWYRTA